jgi:hypothetical protein
MFRLGNKLVVWLGKSAVMQEVSKFHGPPSHNAFWVGAFHFIQIPADQLKPHAGKVHITRPKSLLRKHVVVVRRLPFSHLTL